MLILPAIMTKKLDPTNTKGTRVCAYYRRPSDGKRVSHVSHWCYSSKEKRERFLWLRQAGLAYSIQGRTRDWEEDTEFNHLKAALPLIQKVVKDAYPLLTMEEAWLSVGDITGGFVFIIGEKP